MHTQTIKYACLAAMLFYATCDTILAQHRYVDEAGRADWIRHHLGGIETVYSDGKSIVVKTDENVIARLRNSDGKIEWRRVFDDETIIGTDFSTSTRKLATVSVPETLQTSNNRKDHLHNACTIRVWHAQSGRLDVDERIEFITHSTMVQDELVDNQVGYSEIISHHTTVITTPNIHVVQCGDNLVGFDDTGFSKWTWSPEFDKTIGFVGYNPRTGRLIVVQHPVSKAEQIVEYQVVEILADLGKKVDNTIEFQCKTSGVIFSSSSLTAMCSNAQPATLIDLTSSQKILIESSDQLDTVISVSSKTFSDSHDGFELVASNGNHFMVYPARSATSTSAVDISARGESVTSPLKQTLSYQLFSVSSTGDNAVIASGKNVLVTVNLQTGVCNKEFAQCPLTIRLSSPGAKDNVQLSSYKVSQFPVDLDCLVQVKRIFAYIPRARGATQYMRVLVQMTDLSHHLIRLKLENKPSDNEKHIAVVWTRDDGLARPRDLVTLEAAPSEDRELMVPSSIADEFTGLSSTTMNDDRTNEDSSVEDLNEDPLLSFSVRLRLQWWFARSRIQRLLVRLTSFLQDPENLFQSLIPKPSGPTSDGLAPSNRTLTDPVYGYDRTVIILSELDNHQYGIFAVRGESGAVLWKRVLSTDVGSDAATFAKLVVTRPHQVSQMMPQVVCILSQDVKDTQSGQSLLYWINAWTGKVEKNDLVQRTTTSVLALPTQHVHAKGHSAVIMLISGHSEDKHALSVTFRPNTNDVIQQIDSFARQLVFYTVDSNKQHVSGWSLQMPQDTTDNTVADGTYEVIPAWTYYVEGQKILHVAAQHDDTRGSDNAPVHVVGDDSLLVKWPSAHLISVMVESHEQDNENEAKIPVLQMVILDGVTGRVISSRSHLHAVEPVHACVVDNWIFYSWWSASNQRTELGVVSLYEGALDSRELTPWSSSNTARSIKQSSGDYSAFTTSMQKPLVLFRQYILPRAVRELSVTRTKQGLTNRQLLIGTPNGEVWAVDRHLLDPRRPDCEAGTIEHVEKLIKYSPYIPILFTQVPTYTHSVAKLQQITTAPANLESTSLVFASGLDLFHTRATPSRTFDALNEDFNASLLIVLLFVLVIAAFFVKSALDKKQLDQSWA